MGSVTKFEEQGYTVVKLDGVVMRGQGSDDVREIFLKLAKTEHPKVLLDLGTATKIDSSVLGELVSGFTAVTKTGQFETHIPEKSHVVDMLRITKLIDVLNPHTDRSEAANKLLAPQRTATPQAAATNSALNAG